jgi:hypothetical protein
MSKYDQTITQLTSIVHYIIMLLVVKKKYIYIKIIYMTSFDINYSEMYFL